MIGWATQSLPDTIAPHLQLQVHRLISRFGMPAPVAKTGAALAYETTGGARMNASYPIQIIAEIEFVWTRDLVREHADGSRAFLPSRLRARAGASPTSTRRRAPNGSALSSQLSRRA